MAPTIVRDGQFRLFFFFSGRDTHSCPCGARGRRSEVLAYTTSCDSQPYWSFCDATSASASSCKCPLKGDPRCLEPTLWQLKLPTFRSTVFGCCLPMKNCSCLLNNSLGLEMGRSNRFQKSSGRPPTIFIGHCWTSTCQCSPYGIHLHFRLFQAHWANELWLSGILGA